MSAIASRNGDTKAHEIERDVISLDGDASGAVARQVVRAGFCDRVSAADGCARLGGLGCGFGDFRRHLCRLGQVDTVLLHAEAFALDLAGEVQPTLRRVIQRSPQP